MTKRASQVLPLPLEKDRPLLDHQVRHDVLLQADPPKIGTVLRFVAEADDRCAHGAQTGRSSALQMQVVSPDELFYEILIRQRAERAKFLAALEAVEKQTPVLAGQPKPDDFLQVMRVHHTALAAARPDRRPGRRHAPGDEAQPGRLAQVAPAACSRRHRPDPGTHRRTDEPGAKRAAVARRGRVEPRAQARPRLDGCTVKLLQR